MIANGARAPAAAALRIGMAVSASRRRARLEAQRPKPVRATRKSAISHGIDFQLRPSGELAVVKFGRSGGAKERVGMSDTIKALCRHMTVIAGGRA